MLYSYLAVELSPVMLYWMVPKSIVSLITNEVHQHTITLRDSGFIEIIAYPNITLLPDCNRRLSSDHSQVRKCQCEDLQIQSLTTACLYLY